MTELFPLPMIPTRTFAPSANWKVESRCDRHPFRCTRVIMNSAWSKTLRKTKRGRNRKPHETKELSDSCDPINAHLPDTWFPNSFWQPFRTIFSIHAKFHTGTLEDMDAVGAISVSSAALTKSNIFEAACCCFQCGLSWLSTSENGTCPTLSQNVVFPCAGTGTSFFHSFRHLVHLKGCSLLYL